MYARVKIYENERTESEWSDVIATCITNSISLLIPSLARSIRRLRSSGCLQLMNTFACILCRQLLGEQQETQDMCIILRPKKKRNQTSGDIESKRRARRVKRAKNGVENENKPTHCASPEPLRLCDRIAGGAREREKAFVIICTSTQLHWQNCLNLAPNAVPFVSDSAVRCAFAAFECDSIASIWFRLNANDKLKRQFTYYFSILSSLMRTVSFVFPSICLLVCELMDTVAALRAHRR